VILISNNNDDTLSEENICIIHDEEYTKICEACICMFCDKCNNSCGVVDIKDYRPKTLINMENFKSKLNIKINGLKCIIEIIRPYNEFQSISKQFEDIIDTILVDISHVDTFNQLINDDNLSISNIIKRKNYILTNITVIPKEIPFYKDENLFIIMEYVKMILEREADINAKSNGYILGTASDNDRLDIVECLLKYGADVHANTDYALVRASYKCHLDVVECLLKYGADVHANNDEALCWASYNGHLAVVKYLIEHGADIHSKDDYAFRLACQNDHLDVVKYLVDRGADIHAGNDYALRWASNNGNLDIVKCLISHGANIHAKNDKALRNASVRGNEDVIKYLISHGADVSVLNKN
jgi:hypothetical protein